MAIDDNASYELTGYQVKDLAGRIRRKAEASSVPTSISDLGQVTSSDIDWLSVMNVIYPVGSIYMSATMSTVAQVQTALGGTWVAWGAGRVPVGVDASQTEFDTVEETGGEKAHTLTTAEMPAHTHPANEEWVGYSTSNTWLHIGGGSDSEFQTGTYSRSGYTTQSSGGGGAHNNLQPYITCYMYKRTA